MRLIVLFVLSVVVTLNNTSYGQHTGDAIVGTWLTADETGEIEIYKDKGVYFGKITAGTSEQKHDIHNPDPKRRSDPLLGLVILRDLRFDGDDLWEDGTVYDPKNGKRYSCNVRLLSRDTLKITGYIGFSWIGRSEEWTRIR